MKGDTELEDTRDDLSESSKAEHIYYWVAALFMPILLFSSVAVKRYVADEATFPSIYAVQTYTLMWTPLALVFGIYSVTVLSASRVVYRNDGSLYIQRIRFSSKLFGLPTNGTEESSTAEAELMVPLVLGAEMFWSIMIVAGMFIVRASASEVNPTVVLLELEPFVFTILYMLTVAVKITATKEAGFSLLSKIHVLSIFSGFQIVASLASGLLAFAFILPEQLYIFSLVLNNSKMFPKSVPPPGVEWKPLNQFGPEAKASKMEHIIFWVNALTSGVFLASTQSVDVALTDNGDNEGEVVASSILVVFGVFLFSFDLASVIGLSANRAIYRTKDHSKRYIPCIQVSSRSLGCPRCGGGDFIKDSSQALFSIVLIESVILVGLIALLLYVELGIGPFIGSSPLILILPIIELGFIAFKIYISRKFFWQLVRKRNVCFPFSLVIEFIFILTSTFVIGIIAIPEQLLAFIFVMRNSPAYPAAGDRVDDTIVEVVANLV